MQADRLLGPEVTDADGIVEERKKTISLFNGPVPVLVAAVEALAPFDSEALKRLCHERLGRIYMPHAIVQIDALPRNETGKVMRSALAARIKISSRDATTVKDTTSCNSTSQRC
jgi:hypothetical protein